MKLLTHKEYEQLSPVKRSVYEKRVKQYYDNKTKAFTTEPWKSFLERSSTVMLYDPYSGHRFVTAKDFLDANETAVSILAKDENMTIDEATIRLCEEVGL